MKAEWKAHKLKDVCSRLSSGKGISAKKISVDGYYPVYGGNGIRGYTDIQNFCGECAIIGRQGAYCGNVRYFSGKAYMTEHAIVVCANQENNTRYLMYLLSTMNLGRLSGQSAQPGLSVQKLIIKQFSFPYRAEQQKIADCLSSLDSLIQTQQKVVTTWQQRKKALLQQMFI